MFNVRSQEVLQELHWGVHVEIINYRDYHLINHHPEHSQDVPLPQKQSEATAERYFLPSRHIHESLSELLRKRCFDGMSVLALFG